MQFDSPTQQLNTTNDSTLYRNQMFAAKLTCQIPNVPAGNYKVTMLFAELRLGPPPCTAAGSRVFSIALEGTVLVANFDLLSEGGGCAALGGPGQPVDKVFTVAVSDGTLDIEEDASMGAAVLDAIEIEPAP